MVKAADKAMEIGEIVLVKKTGGKSGTFVRSPSARPRG
jgi:molybdenum cofactor biosynthesis enzyme